MIRRVVVMVLVICALADSALALRVGPARPPRRPAPARKPNLWEKVQAGPTDKLGTLMTQGKQQFERGQLSQAAVTFDKAVRQAPQDPQAHAWLARTRLRLKDHGGCYESAKQAMALLPREHQPLAGKEPPEPEHSLMVCAFHTGHYDESVTAGEAALRGAGLSGEQRGEILGWLELGEAARGRLSQAAAHGEQACQLASKRGSTLYGRARLGLAMIYDRDGRDAEARQVALEVVGAYTVEQILGGDLVWAPGDADYVAALYVMANMAAGRTGLGPIQNDRLLARAFFQRFVARSAASPWVSRAQAHLFDLGGSELAGGDFHFKGGVDGNPAPYEKLAVAALPELRRCLGSAPGALVTLTVTLPVKASAVARPAPPPPPPRPGMRPPQPAPRPPTVMPRRISAAAAPRMGVPQTTLDCVNRVADGVAWPTPTAAPVSFNFAIAI